ncbi:MAG: 3-oxoacyl-[acyl-carrier-protein] synthase, partial [Bacteroidota bacterium]|nr:3-oxoacyl-[acyl-carrier-protein] synthase [Bacteroidota bacterium]
MSLDICSKIVATGSYIPKRIVKNSDFLINEFFDTNGEKVTRPNEITIEKFEEITGIFERRYVDDDLVTSDIAYLAAKDALESSGIDKETLDYIIVAHNFGDVKFDNRKSDIVPSIASRIKNHLRIFNPFTVAYDLVFGCPGWLQGV